MLPLNQIHNFTEDIMSMLIGSLNCKIIKELWVKYLLCMLIREIMHEPINW